ncbi:MAG: 30S ribosomal protein S8 [Deltaproteobacteria bacterium]|nr:MAG: 30S ribosomal protein S8 [Deltaproteobacteria bacterium]
MTDPIADLLTRIRNGQQAGHKSVTLAASKVKVAITSILADEGYIAGYAQHQGTPRGLIEITLKYDNDGNGAIHELQRASKPGRRVYVGAGDIPKVRSGLGTAIVSTSRGILAGHAARKENVGGELLCTVW